MKKNVSKLILLLLTLSLITAMAAGCQQKSDTGNVEKSPSLFPVTIQDVYGTKVTVEKEPERIVSLAPSTVEVLYKLGLGDKIVGVTEFCDYPEEAKSKAKVGDFNGVNIEKIIEAKPDIVFAGSGMSKEDFQKLTDLKITVLVTEAKALSEIPETFLMIGKATGTENKAKVLTAQVNKKIDDIKNKAKDAKKVKTYFALSFGKAGNWTAGKGTFISDLVGIAGGENISDDVESWKEYSLEKIVEKNPELIFLSNMVSNGSKDTLDNENGYKDTSAVKNDKVVILDDNVVLRPGPRIIEGLDIIAKAIHPEIFNK